MVLYASEQSAVKAAVGVTLLSVVLVFVFLRVELCAHAMPALFQTQRSELIVLL